MNAAAALLLGYLLGTRGGPVELDQLVGALKALCDTDEFADVVAAARSQLGGTLRDLAQVLEGPRGSDEVAEDLVARVRQLVGSD